MTLGSGGHSEEICKRAKNIKIIGFDADKKALDRSAEKVKSVSKSFEFVNTYFDDLKKELDKRGIGRVDGIIFYLGLNSEQQAAS
jgi:16S rRNA (cytosine1402-N4)-methyltransferase